MTKEIIENDPYKSAGVDIDAGNELIEKIKADVASTQNVNVLGNIGGFAGMYEIGKEFDLKPIGMHVIDACRIEKGFRHFGHDISEEDHIVDAGLAFAAPKTKTGYIGEAAVKARRESGAQNRLIQVLAKDPSVMFYHNEPIYRDGKMAGYLTSGNYGH